MLLTVRVASAVALLGTAVGLLITAVRVAMGTVAE
jgi:hypothetical protein